VNQCWPLMCGQTPPGRLIVMDSIRTISRFAAVLIVLAAAILLAAPGFA
jgi:hypothetical protein